MQEINEKHIESMKKFIGHQKTIIFFLGIIVAITILFLLKQAQAVFVPFTIAWVLSRLLTPIMLFLKTKKVPTGLSVAFLLLGMTVLFSVIGLIVSLSTASLTHELPTYLSKSTVTIQKISNEVVKKFPQLASMGEKAEPSDTTMSEQIQKLQQNTMVEPEVLDIPVNEQTKKSQQNNQGKNKIQEEINKQILNLSKEALNLATTILSTLTSIVSSAIMILVMLAFMLISAANSKAKIDNAFSPELSSRINSVINSISSQISKYLYIQTMISLITGILVGCLQTFRNKLSSHMGVFSVSFKLYSNSRFYYCISTSNHNCFNNLLPKLVANYRNNCGNFRHSTSHGQCYCSKTYG